jgi:hypothetical protein
MQAELISMTVQPDRTLLTLDIRLTNPFAKTKHIGFDVLGVFMGDGSVTVPGNDGLNMAGSSDQQLLNPDGFTRWFNYPEFSGAGSIWSLFGYDAFSGGALTPSARLNGYKYYADGLDSTGDPFEFLLGHAESRGSFYPQVTNTRRFDLSFPKTNGISFTLGVIAHWEPNSNNPGLPDDLFDFPPEANSEEAPVIDVVDESTAYYINETEKGGYVRLKISVWDWSAALNGDIIDEYQIRCYSDAWAGPNVVDMKPIYASSHYFTFKTAIPVTNVHSLDPIPIWIEIKYPGSDYSNNFGVPNDATGNLTAYFPAQARVLDYKPLWIIVIQPNGGEQLEVGKNYEIKWESENLVGTVFITFSRDNFLKDIHPIAVNEKNDGSFLWDNIPDLVSETVKVKISSMKNSSINDISDNDFRIFDSTAPFIRVVRPNGDELWKAGTAREITWVSKNVPGTVFIEYSKDNFASDTHIIAIDTENDGSFLWEDIPHDLSSTVRVRISSMLDPDIFDISDGDFTIDAPPIEVLSPDGGEEWKAGSSHYITWETIESVGNLKIEYSKDYFLSDIHAIAANTTDSGSFLWQNIPNDPSTTVRVRISSVLDPAMRDISDGNFSIEESGWGLSFGGVDNENAYDVALDSLGNIYVTGVFKGSNVDFNPDPAATDYHSSTGGMDVFLAKFGPLADFKWAKTWGGPGYDRGYALATDPSGNVIVTGIFKGTNVDFNPGALPSEKDLHTSVGGYDVFLSRFDPTGKFLWAKTFGGTGNDKGAGIDTDQFSNIYITGSFRGSADLNPGAAKDTRTSIGLSDIFLSGFDSSGALIWAESWGGNTQTEGYDEGFSVAVGDFADIWVTGNAAGVDIDFDPDPADQFLLNAFGGCDAFLSKFDLTGNLEWAGLWGASADDYGFGVETGQDGSAYVTGRFEGVVDFDPSDTAEVHSSEGSGYDAFLSEFNLLGAHQWTRTWGAADYNEYGWSVAVGGDDTVYVTGDFEGACDFDPGTSVDEHISNGDFDIFLSSFNSAGWYNWARTWGGGTAMDYGYGVAADSNGNAYISGGIAGLDLDFNPGPEIDSRNTQNADVYLMKIMPDGEW